MRILDLTGYESWLKAEGYQRSTTEMTLRQLRLAIAESHAGKRFSPRRVPHVRRYLAFVAETRKNPAGGELISCARSRGLHAVVKGRQHGARTREVLSPKQWSELRSALRRTKEPVALLIVAYMHAGRRISPFLRLHPRMARFENVIADKLSRDWIKSVANGHAHIYQILCTTERCAYARMRRRLQLFCEQTGFDVDLDTLYRSQKQEQNEEVKLFPRKPSHVKRSDNG